MKYSFTAGSFFIIALLLVTAGNVFAQNKSGVVYKKTGMVSLVNANANKAVLSISTAKKENVFLCRLQLHDASTTHLLKEKEIIAHDSISNEHIIGKLGNTLWILTDSLVGYNVQTLEPVAGENDIAAKNPFMQYNFSRYSNAYLLDESAQVLYITAANGDRYKLYDAGFLMKPDNTQSDTSPDDYSYEYAAEYKINGRYLLKYALTNIDTCGNMLYILGSTKEGAQVLNYFGSSIYSDREEVRMLTILPYKMIGDKIDYSKSKPISGSKKYFKAGFLQKKFYANAWHGSNGERIIIFENNRKLSIASTERSGKELWSVNTNQFSNNFADYIIDDNHLILWFKNNGYVMLAINLQNGTFNKK